MGRLRTLLVVLSVSAGVLVPGAGAGPAAAVADGPSLVLLTAAPRQNDLVEFRVEGVRRPEPGENPFDPTQFDTAVFFSGPDGRVLRTSAFWHEGCLPCVGPLPTDGWRVRLLAETPGTWVGQAEDGPLFDFDVAASDLPGVVRRVGNRLVEPDGTPYLARGENVSWSEHNDPADYEAWYGRLGGVGANWNRLWLSSWAFGIEWSDTPLGDYRPRLERAAFLDDVLSRGVAHGIRSQLVLQNHGAFSTAFNSEWAENPYNTANGGPLGAPQQVWSDPEARRLFKARYRYLVSRYWAHPGMLAWELWNEADLVDGNVFPDPAALAWHREMSDYVRSLDPLARPITTSYTTFRFFFDDGSVFRLPNVDIAELHYYALGGLLGDFPFWWSFLVPAWRAKTGRPVLVAEAGLDSEGVAETVALDPDGRALFFMSWAGLFSGAAGTGMTWWWDNYVHPRDLYHRMEGADRFAAANAEVLSRGEPGYATALGLDAFVLAQRVTDGAAGAVWVRNAADTWHTEDSRRVRQSFLLVPAGGQIRLQWWDTTTGLPRGPDYRSGIPFAGFVIVPVPEFRGSTALTYTPE